jgi:hypothetical protein
MKVGGAPIDLHLHDAVVVMSVRGDTVTGTLAGVLAAEDLVAAVRPVLGAASPAFCTPATFDGFARQIRQTADILIDASNAPGVPCDGISFGVGFTGKRIANPIRVGPPAVSDASCP